MKTDEIIKTLGEVIAAKSVKSAPLPDKPFGEGPARALEIMLGLADEMGFETKNYDNYVGEISYGEGERTMGILCHLDVVPEGSGWDYPPFEATRVGDRIYGRGTMDDKTPAVVCLYAMKALKDEGFRPACKIKLILGCDEESGWGCIDHYKKVAALPDFGFSPDADYPVIYAEKGILHLRFAFENRVTRFKALSGGDRPNMVCARCSMKGEATDEQLEKFNLRRENGLIVSVGKNAHGSTPQLGVNAIPALLNLIIDCGEDVSDILANLFEDKQGLTKLFDETGNLTLSPNLIEMKGDRIFVTADIRYPATKTREQVLALADKMGVPYEIVNDQAPLYNDKNGFLVRTLLSVYEEVTGRKAEPVAIGGGTYARALPMGAAFGPELPGAESTVHQANEYVTVENIAFMYETYLLAIRRLTEKPF